ncbi:MAG: nucleotide sugar dehydrogenase [Dehalococcoidia bacterium]|jgi:UDP-N-acetyl-D-mannosaminuronic acid dehydrogenase
MNSLSVCVVGLGRIGLPLAAQCASKGMRVTGADIDAALVGKVNAGTCPYPDEGGLADAMATAHAAGLLTATTDTAAAVRQSNVVVIVIPVGLTAEKRADFTALDAAARAVAKGLQPQALVVLETTVPLGTTRRRLGAALEASGRRLGSDLFLAYSPERVFVGRVLTDLRHYPKVVGGVDDESARRAGAFYEKALDAPVMRLGSCEAAELVKLAETAYRDVNIALANEFARVADEHGVDIAEVIAAANSQPFSHIHQPGVGVGGHCIPVYPRFLLEEAKARLPEAAREINDGMAAYAVDKLAEALGGLKEKTVLILGLSYRPDVKESAFSSAFLLAGELTARGARVIVHDPLFSGDELRALALEPAEPFPPPHADAVIVQALHEAYREIDFRAFPGCRVVLDGRDALSREKIEALGIRYLGIGR